MNLTNHAFLEAAFKHMAYDNNVVNRFRTYEKARDACGVNLDEFGFTDVQLLSANAELSELSEDELYDACCGCADEPEHPPLSELTEKVLNAIFESL